MKRTLSKLALLIVLATALLGCNRVDLYTNLDEQDTNEIQAILLRQGIDCDKTMGKEQTWGLQVDKNQMAAAVEILKGFGYPKNKFADMGEIFKKEGLVSSPQEDRIRFIYALSETVAETISLIDGVVSARVHIVLPENDPLSEYFQPSSASVFIKYRQAMDIKKFIHPIKQLVVNSIEGLNYEKVSIVPFSTPVVSAAPRTFSRIMGIEIDAAYTARFRMIVYGLVFFLTVLMIACGYLVWRKVAPSAGHTKKRERHDVLAV